MQRRFQRGDHRGARTAGAASAHLPPDDGDEQDSKEPSLRTRAAQEGEPRATHTAAPESRAPHAQPCQKATRQRAARQSRTRKRRAAPAAARQPPVPSPDASGGAHAIAGRAALASASLAAFRSAPTGPLHGSAVLAVADAILPSLPALPRSKSTRSSALPWRRCSRFLCD